MYTIEYDATYDSWKIFDKDGDWICDVDSEVEAQVLLSHLNRG